MFKNLRAEMAREGLTIRAISNKLGITDKTFRSKLHGKTEFTRSEMVKLRNTFFSNLTIEYLFEFVDKAIA